MSLRDINGHHIFQSALQLASEGDSIIYDLCVCVHKTQNMKRQVTPVTQIPAQASSYIIMLCCLISNLFLHSIPISFCGIQERINPESDKSPYGFLEFIIRVGWRTKPMQMHAWT